MLLSTISSLLSDFQFRKLFQLLKAQALMRLTFHFIFRNNITEKIRIMQNLKRVLKN